MSILNGTSLSSTGSVLGGASNELGLDTVTGLEELAKENGYKESKVLSALNTVGRVLNFGTANVSGAVRGAVRGEGIIEGARLGREENLGFAEVYRDLYGKPDTVAGKIAVGVGGFAADVLFDPLTYLTLGTSAGAKVAGKVLTKPGTRISQRLSANTLNSTRDILIAEGHSVGKAKRMAQTTANRVVNDIFSKSFGKSGLTSEGAAKIATDRLEEQLGRKLTVAEADDFISKVAATRDIDAIMQSGTKLIDEGGIKYFGKTLVSSERLANTLIGQAARRLGETEIAQALKNTTGRLFVDGYQKNPKIQEIIGRARIANMRAFKSINDQVNGIFKDFNERENLEFFNAVFDKRTEVLGNTREIQEQTVKELNQMFPDLKVKDRDSAIRLYDSLDEVHHKRIADIHEKMQKMTEGFFKEREARIQKGDQIEGMADALAGPNQVSLERIDKLNRELQDLKQILKGKRMEAGSSAKKVKSVDEISVELSEEAAIGAAAKLVRYEEERLTEEIDRIIEKIRNIKPGDGPAPAVPKLGNAPKKANMLEEILQAEEMVKKLERDYVKKVQGLRKIIDAKRIAKAKQLDEKLEFFLEDGTPNVKLNKAADMLFEGEGAIVRKLAKEAGISEEDAFKFYLPSKFRDKVKVKEYAMGRYLSTPSMSFQKDFNGVVNDELIRDPAEALKRGKLEVRTAKIKSQAIRQAVGSLGIKDANGQLVTDLTKEEMRKYGVEKFSRNTIDGTVTGYLPKEIVEELNEFLQPGKSVIDDAAQAFGFDWVTGLFKGYVTSLFPAFHVRNMIGNEFQLFLKFGVNTYDPKIQKRAVDIVLGRNLDEKMVAKTGKVWTNREIINAIKKETDFLEEGAFGDTEQLLRGIQNGGKWNPFSRENIALQTGRKVGETLEGQAKLTGIIAGLMEGKTIKEAVKEAEDVLFNYNKITPFERSVMRRLIPFYTFARKNFELQLKALSTTPGRVATQLKFIKGAGETIGEPISEEDREGLPPWVVDSLGIKAGANQYGQATYLTGFGLPIEEFLQRFSGDKGIIWNALSSEMAKMNPAIKYPMERATGLDFFRGRPITEIDNGTDLKPILDVMPEGVADELKALLQYQEREVGLYVNGEKVGTKTKVTANPIALHLFRNLPTARIQATAGSLYKEEEPEWMTALRLISGVRGETIDTEEQKFFNDLEKKEKLQAYLVRMGVLGIKEIPYEKGVQETESLLE